MKTDEWFFQLRPWPGYAVHLRVAVLVLVWRFAISFISFLFPAIFPCPATNFRQFTSPSCRLKFGSSKSPPLTSFPHFCTSSLHRTLSMLLRVWGRAICSHLLELIKRLWFLRSQLPAPVSFGFSLCWYFRFLRFGCPRICGASKFLCQGYQFRWHVHLSKEPAPIPWCFPAFPWDCWVLSLRCVHSRQAFL